MSFVLKPLPMDVDLETRAVLKQAAAAHRRLAELKGLSSSIPNQGVLINTLALQEAKDSSAIENIITTQDDLFKEELFPELLKNASAKEVQNYVSALRTGFELLQKHQLLTVNNMIQIQTELEQNRAGLRNVAGTNLKNLATGDVIYTPPQDHADVVALMSNLEKFLNDPEFYDADPLIKMAVAHYQFESIHPFYDGNGRTGRILNVLYLVMQGLLDIPVLYLSRHIIRTKADYYRLLQEVREKDAWEEWVLYILVAVEKTSLYAIRLIRGIQKAMQDYKHRIRKEFKFYSQDLINNLFFHPYTKIEFIERDLKVSRLTAAKYLNSLCDAGFLKKEKFGRANYYINVALYELLAQEEL